MYTFRPYVAYSIECRLKGKVLLSGLSIDSKMLTGAQGEPSGLCDDPAALARANSDDDVFLLYAELLCTPLARV